jgi:hypothetical protein
MTVPRVAALLLSATMIFGATALGWNTIDPPTASTDVFTIKMEDCKTMRPASITSETSTLGLIFGGRGKDELVKRGSLDVDGKKYTLYLPKAKAYTTTNSKSNDSGFENTSTLLSIDQKGDGLLTEREGWFANLPIRLGDRMFDIVEIAADGSRIALKASKAPLSGVIVGRQCPPFSFKTADGKIVSDETLSGKAVLLDIWSIT